MYLKRLIYICSGTLLFLCSCLQSYVEELSTQYADLKVNDKGFICQIVNKQNGKNYLPEEKPSPILALYDGTKYILPTHLQVEPNKWIITFENQSQASISKEIKENSQIRNDVYKYYEYIQFKRAHFDCEKVEYNNETGRITKMKFKFNGKFN